MSALKQSTIDQITAEVFGDKADAEIIAGTPRGILAGEKPPTGMLRRYAKAIGFDVPKRPKRVAPTFGGSLKLDNEVSEALATIRRKIGFTTSHATIIRNALIAYAKALAVDTNT